MHFAVRYEVRRDYGGKEKETRRERLFRFAQPDVAVVYPPEALAHLWQWFWELVSQRKQDEPLGFSEMLAWSRLMQIPITPWEAKVLVQMDNRYLSTQHEESEAAREIVKNRQQATTNK